jgi:hypothetical protein
MQDTLAVGPKRFVRVTNSAVAGLRLQNQSPHNSIMLLATPTNEAPTSLRGAVELFAGMGLTPEVTLQSLFPGALAVGANGHVWVWAADGATISVSHA